MSAIRFHRALAAALAGLCVLPAAQAWDFGKMRPEEVAFYVQDLHTGRVLAEHRADASMNPASTMKLVTAFAAFSTLPPDYRWRTEWKTAAPVAGHTLQGDLYWVGSGNPVFDQPDIRAMQAQLHAQGIERLGGKVVLDRSIWPPQAPAAGFEDDEGELFTTPPDPHMVAYKVLWLTLGKDEAGQTVLELNPPLPDTPLNTDELRRVNSGSCYLKNRMGGEYRDGVLYLRGRLPTHCIGSSTYINIFDTPAFARQSFRSHWLAAGGNDAPFAEGKTPAQARTVAVNDSKPLTEVLTDMNKYSNNVIARSVFLTLGTHTAAGRTQNPDHAVRRALAASGLDDEALVLENGSGLSRRERVTARFLGQLLDKAYRSPFQSAFIHTLPVAGIDGTLQTRFKQVGNSLRLKTGTLKNVRALAGYWLPETSGQNPLAVVVLVNSERSEGYLTDLDRLVQNLIRQPQTLEKP